MPLVKLYANLRKLAGTKELSITGATVGVVINELAKQNPPIGDVILKDGKLRQHIIVTLNGINTIDLETPVTEQDVVAIFPPIAGGTSPLTPLRHSLAPCGLSRTRAGVRRTPVQVSTPMGAPIRRGEPRRK